LRYPDESALPAFATAPKETLALADALAGVMRDDAIDGILRQAATDSWDSSAGARNSAVR